jgi:hypothetical protein
MEFELPAALLYGFGALLVILGGLRAYHLGWKRKVELDAEAAEAAGADASEGVDAGEGEDVRGGGSAAGGRRRDGGGYKRHLAWGVVWMGMGLFLIISTLMKRG